MAHHEEEQPLLPTLRDPVVDRALRASLRVLRDQCDDPALRERIDRVARSDGSLRDLARDADFAAFVDPLAERGRTEWEQMPAHERERRTATLEEPGRPRD